MVRPAEALDHAEVSAEAASAIRGLIERIVLTSGEKWAEMDAVLHGDLGTIPEWVKSGREITRIDIPISEMSILTVAGARFSRDRHALVVEI